MKKLVAMLSVFLFTFGVAKAGELSISGNAKASYAISSSDGTAGQVNKQPGLGISNEFTLGASGELDNGYAWSYAIDIDSVESSATNDDAKLTLSGPIGTFGIFLGEGGMGVENAASQSVIARPSDTSYAEAMTDTFDIDGFDNLQYHSPADMLPFGITFKIGHAPNAVGTQANDFKAAGTIHDRVASADTAAIGGITLDGGGDSMTMYQVKASPIDGLSLGADYAEFSGVIGATDQAPESGSYFATYTFGPATIGYSKSYAALALTNADTPAEVESVENTKFSIGINVNENLSVSYEEEESDATMKNAATTHGTITSSGIQAAYTMGGMTLGVAMNDHENAAYTKNQDVKDTVFTMQMAF
tara:strand:+ start:894 stop:1976 length:1083 start_codon:yes stop_codon:yes gene_type:complete